MKKTYLDSSFITCFFIPGHIFQAPALRKLAELRLNKDKLYISPLVLDEVWWAIYKEKSKQGLILNGMVDCLKEIKDSFNLLKTYGIAKIIQLKKPIEDKVLKTLEIMENENLKPRDAFHLITAQSQGLNEIVAHDKGFLKANASRYSLTLTDFVANP